MTQQPSLPGIEIKTGKKVDTTHIEERRLFEQMIGGSPLGDLYLQILNEGWYWRDGAWIAWNLFPKNLRHPKTKKELCNILGIGRQQMSRRVSANPAIKARILKGMVVTTILDAIKPVLEQSIHIAKSQGRDGFNDRRMLLEMAKLYKRSGEGVTIVQNAPTETTIIEGGVGEMEAELARLTGQNE